MDASDEVIPTEDFEDDVDPKLDDDTGDADDVVDDATDDAAVDVDDDADDADADEYHPPVPKRVHVYHQIPESTEIRIVPPEDRRTSEYMTIYEYTMVVGTRATHIAEGSVLYTNPSGLYDPREIAKKEIDEGLCPLSITRKISPTQIEIWEVNEMVKPQL